MKIKIAQREQRVMRIFVFIFVFSRKCWCVSAFCKSFFFIKSQSVRLNTKNATNLSGNGESFYGNFVKLQQPNQREPTRVFDFTFGFFDVSGCSTWFQHSMEWRPRFTTNYFQDFCTWSLGTLQRWRWRR